MTTVAAPNLRYVLPWLDIRTTCRSNLPVVYDFTRQCLQNQDSGTANSVASNWFSKGCHSESGRRPGEEPAFPRRCPRRNFHNWGTSRLSLVYSQETLLRAWRYRDSLKEGAPLRPRLYRVATNACLESMSVVWFPASSETFQ